MTQLIVKQIFIDTDLRMGSVGLSKIIAKAGHRRVYNLKDFEVYVFLNRKRNKCKIFRGDVIIYHNKLTISTVDIVDSLPEILKMIGDTFGLEFEISKSAEKRLTNKILSRHFRS